VTVVWGLSLYIQMQSAVSRSPSCIHEHAVSGQFVNVVRSEAAAMCSFSCTHSSCTLYSKDCGSRRQARTHHASAPILSSWLWTLLLCRHCGNSGLGLQHSLHCQCGNSAVALRHLLQDVLPSALNHCRSGQYCCLAKPLWHH